jgi:hypothetical protein
LREKAAPLLSHNGGSSSVKCVAVSSAAVIRPGFAQADGQVRRPSKATIFLLNLWIVQQPQKRLFESLVLLGLFDLVFSFGSIFQSAVPD